MRKIEIYEIFELCTEDCDNAGPQVSFKNGNSSVVVKGFFDNGRYTVRFMPRSEGVWRYELVCGNARTSGEFLCVPTTSNNHGPVVADGFHFKYADGKRYLPVGTTCYAWIHQTKEMMAQTLDTLAKSPFNKVRMCVFPKHMPFNNNEPELFPFHKKPDGGWDVANPNEEFWRHLEDGIKKLCGMGIEADLILFHPYDRWGFAKLSKEDSLAYLDYCIRRLSAFRNIWWSLANEYDLVPGRTTADWDAFGEKIATADPYNHMLSNHNCFTVYPKRDWMTHCSIQAIESDNVKSVIDWRKGYNLPVIVDECGYEGDIEFAWGNISAFEMVNRFWVCNVLGAYCTHGETFFREDGVLWWAKGGKLYGESAGRISFMKDIMDRLGNLDPLGSLFSFNPNDSSYDDNFEHNHFFSTINALPEHKRRQVLLGFEPIAGCNDDYRIHYFARTCRAYLDAKLPENGKYKVEIIDVWEMTVETAIDEASGALRVKLPGKEGVAVLISRLDGEGLGKGVKS